METAQGGSASLTFGCQDHLSMPKHCKHHKHTLKIHPSKSFQRRPVLSTVQHEMKLSPQRGSFHHETIWFRNQSDFSLLLEDKTILKKRNSLIFHLSSLLRRQSLLQSCTHSNCKRRFNQHCSITAVQKLSKVKIFSSQGSALLSQQIQRTCKYKGKKPAQETTINPPPCTPENEKTNLLPGGPQGA